MRHSMVRCVITALILAQAIYANDINTGGQKGIARALSAETFSKTGINVGGAFRYGQDMNMVGFIYEQDNPTVTPSRETLRLFSGNIFAAYGLTYFLDFSIDVPVYADVTGWGQLDHGGIGDIELAGKLQYPWQQYGAVVSHSLYLKAILPTGADDKGFFPRHTYYLQKDVADSDTNLYTTNAVYWNPQLLWTVHFNRMNPKVPLELHLNFGGVITQRKSNSCVVAAIGAEYTPVKPVSIFIEISGESSVLRYTEVFDVSSFDDDVFYLTPGMKFSLPSGIYIKMAGDFGISDDNPTIMHKLSRRGYTYSVRGTPSYGFQATIGWNGIIKRADNDKDGMPNETDKCIDQAEDKDGFEDDDGCPDIDNDGDGMLDNKDECPNEKAVSSGCPVFDADGDKIMDKDDVCPQQFEDFDGFEDTDGCPDLDNDKDGIPDDKDKCPNAVEDKDGFEDADGCPDVDNDGDGVEDTRDKCPGVKGITEKQGCPQTEEIRESLILDGVTFLSGKAKLDPNSFTILDKVAQSLIEWPNVNIEIRGYTDSQGDETLNQKLSQKRAEEVMQYLINKGVRPLRLIAFGLGESSPIADNNTAEGRAKNRRVELHRIK